MTDRRCPCGSSKNYLSCCGLYIEANQLPPSPESLMRSRFTAYTKANINYIKSTMLPPAALGFNEHEARLWAQSVIWDKLTVISTRVDGELGFVEFKACFYDNKKLHTMHEVSEFRLENGKWYYVDGVMQS